MYFNRIALLGAVSSIGSVAAQRPEGTSICDYYTKALLKKNTAANQYTLLTLLVNTAVIGNYTEPSNGVLVPGILNPNGEYNDTAVNLLPYFNGCDISTNNGTEFNLVTNPPISQNFLDGGGAAPLKKNLPADDTTSNQYFLMTHLYQYFGVLLGCSGYSTPGFPSYGGVGSMYRVHQYMALDPYEVGYFITQVGLAAASFGVAQSDIDDVATALFSLFGYKCSAPVTVVPAQGKVLDSICVDVTCAAAPNAMCGLYDNYDGTSPGPVTECSCLTSSTSTMPSSAPTMTVTVTVTSMPKQTQCCCHENWQQGDKREWCNE